MRNCGLEDQITRRVEEKRREEKRREEKRREEKKSRRPEDQKTRRLEETYYTLCPYYSLLIVGVGPPPSVHTPPPQITDTGDVICM
ncbi:hypothetical protein [Paenibacillus sp. Soil750]|uniref:hypothetical protein n=1 Tax=Paenibacillus sp. Soil750 TaxID=1736398 RepID=UPI0012FB2089|nr:hypothetical protein [Paenibacillus sp. Soil750]